MSVSIDPGASGTSRVWVGPEELQSLFGSAAAAVIGSTAATRTRGWLLDATTSEGVGQTAYLPDGWSSFHVDVYWTNPNATTGNVVWRFDHTQLTDGASIDTESAASNVTAAAPSQYVMKVTRVASNITRTADSVLRIDLQRLGADAADTLANDAALLGVMFSRA